MFFRNTKLIKSPTSREKVIFQCDQKFFEDYAFYNLLSCNNVGHDVHIHFINVDDAFLKKVTALNLNIDLSISTEDVDTNINYYKLKSYYFTSRYFITDYLFENALIDIAYITDADIIFNERINIPFSKLGVLYYPRYENNLWKQSGANFLYITKDKHSFLKKIIDEYNKKLLTTDFEMINESIPKYERSNLYALDQVCISLALKTEDLTSTDFINLCQIENFLSNKTMTCKIWSLTAKKNETTKQILKEKFNQLF
jgi:hypothetical protein